MNTMNNPMVKCNKCGQEAVDERALKIHKTSKHGEVPVGRPSKMTPEVLQKIEKVA